MLRLPPRRIVLTASDLDAHNHMREERRRLQGARPNGRHFPMPTHLDVRLRGRRVPQVRLLRGPQRSRDHSVTLADSSRHAARSVTSETDSSDFMTEEETGLLALALNGLSAVQMGTSDSEEMVDDLQNTDPQKVEAESQAQTKSSSQPSSHGPLLDTVPPLASKLASPSLLQTLVAESESDNFLDGMIDIPRHTQLETHTHVDGNTSSGRNAFQFERKKHESSPLDLSSEIRLPNDDRPELRMLDLENKRNEGGQALRATRSLDPLARAFLPRTRFGLVPEDHGFARRLPRAIRSEMNLKPSDQHVSSRSESPFHWQVHELSRSSARARARVNDVVSVPATTRPSGVNEDHGEAPGSSSGSGQYPNATWNLRLGSEPHVAEFVPTRRSATASHGDFRTVGISHDANPRLTSVRSRSTGTNQLFPSSDNNDPSPRSGRTTAPFPRMRLHRPPPTTRLRRPKASSSVPNLAWSRLASSNVELSRISAIKHQYPARSTNDARIPSMVSAASGISISSPMSDTRTSSSGRSLPLLHRSPLDALTDRLRTMMSVPDLRFQGRKRASTRKSGRHSQLPFPGPTHDLMSYSNQYGSPTYGRVDAANRQYQARDPRVPLVQNDSNLSTPSLLKGNTERIAADQIAASSPDHMSSSLALSSSPFSTVARFTPPMQVQLNPRTPATRARQAPLDESSIGRPRTAARSRMQVYDDGQPAALQPQTPADLRHGRAVFARVINEATPSPARQIRAVYDTSSPSELDSAHIAPSHGGRLRGGAAESSHASPEEPSRLAARFGAWHRRVQSTSAEQENEFDPISIAMEPDRATWRARTGANGEETLDSTPPAEGRFERFLR